MARTKQPGRKTNRERHKKENEPNNPIALKVAQEQVEKISRETKKEHSKKMRGRSREEKKGPANEKEQTGPEAQDSQQPSGILPGFLPVSAGTERVHRRDPKPPPKTRKTGPWDEEPSLLGRRGEAPSPKREQMKGHYNEDEPVKKR